MTSHDRSTLRQYLDEGILVAKGSHWETGCETAVVWYDEGMINHWRWALKPGRSNGSGPDHGGSGTLRACLWAVAMLGDG